MTIKEYLDTIIKEMSNDYLSKKHILKRIKRFYEWNDITEEETREYIRKVLAKWNKIIFTNPYVI